MPPSFSLPTVRRLGSLYRAHPYAFVATAAVVACSAAAIARRSRDAERANPPKGGFVEVDGVRLHYVDRGEGAPLVILHGNGAMIRELELSGLVDLASQRYRVIVFDRPGYGHSTRPRGRVWSPQRQARLLKAALDTLRVSRPIVLGHSWGALVALAFAEQYPADVRAAVLASGYYHPTLRPDVVLMSAPAIPVLGALLRYTVSPWLGRLLWRPLLRLVFAPSPIPHRFLSDMPVWMSLRPSQLKAAAEESALMIPAAIALGRRAGTLRVPVVVVAGERDRYVDARRHSARLAHAIPGAELRLVPAAGHMVHHVATAQVMAAIDAAAERSRTSASAPAAIDRRRATPHSVAAGATAPAE